MKIKILALTLLLSGCSFAGLEDVKSQADSFFLERGYEVTGYEGYQYGFTFSPNHGGARVWYILKQVPDNGITYMAYLQQWGDEIHLYELKAIDAIKP